LLTEEVLAEKLRVSALSRFSAISKEERVRVEFSKKRFTTSLARRAGTFFMGRAEISAILSAVSRRRVMSCAERSSMPSRCL